MPLFIYKEIKLTTISNISVENVVSIIKKLRINCIVTIKNMNVNLKFKTLKLLKILIFKTKSKSKSHNP